MSGRRLWKTAGGVGLTMVIAAAATVGIQRFGKASARADIPSATARKGEFLVIIPCRGELVANRTVQITAPLNVPDLRIAWMAPAGSAVKQGDVVLRFDDSGAKRQLQEKQAALAQSQASYDQAMAQAKITEEMDKLELATLGHNVERARLEVSKQEIVSQLQAAESKVDLGLAEEKLQVHKAAMNLNRASAQSKVASLESQRDKSNKDVDVTSRRIGRMEVKAPSTGVVNYLMNYSQGWVNAKPFKVGDNVWPGSAVAEVPDLSSLQLKGKVEEMDRGKINTNQPARIHLDPFPEQSFPATLASISPLTEQNFEWPPSRNFRAYARFEKIDPRLRPGMNGRADVIVDRIPNAISVPAKAVFSRGGRPVVLVLEDQGLREVTIEIVARNPDEVCVKGVNGGARVALADPAAKAKEKK